MKASIGKIVNTDYLALLSIIFPVVVWAIYLDAAYIGLLKLLKPGTQDPGFFFIFAVCATAFFVPVLIFRVKTILVHFENGQETEGTITYLHLFKDRGRIEYNYVFQGQKYHCANGIHRNRSIDTLQQGQKISLIVNKDKPGKALIKELYIDKNRKPTA